MHQRHSADFEHPPAIGGLKAEVLAEMEEDVEEGESPDEKWNHGPGFMA